MKRAAWLVAAALVLAASGTIAEGPFPHGDGDISAEIERAFSDEPSLASSDITVQTQDGVVLLRGFAGTLEDVATAMRLARSVAGVHQVVNGIRLMVRPSRA